MGYGNLEFVTLPAVISETMQAMHQISNIEHQWKITFSKLNGTMYGYSKALTP